MHRLHRHLTLLLTAVVLTACGGGGGGGVADDGASGAAVQAQSLAALAATYEIPVVGGFSWPVAPDVQIGHAGACWDGPVCYWLSESSQALWSVWRDTEPFQSRYERKEGGWHLGANYNLGLEWLDAGRLVYPAAAGKVARVLQNECGWGNMVFVRHDTGKGAFTTVYAQVAWIGGSAPVVGAAVSPASPIAKVGDGAWNDKACRPEFKKRGDQPYQLHFQVRQGTDMTPGSRYSPRRVAVGPQGQVDPNAFIAANRKPPVFDDFDQPVLDPAKWAIEPIVTDCCGAGNLATVTPGQGHVLIDVTGGSAGSYGVVDGIRLRPIIGPLAADFEVTVAGREVLRESRDGTTTSSGYGIELVTATSRVTLQVIGDAWNAGGAAGHKVVGSYTEGPITYYAIFNDLPIGQYFPVHMRVRRTSGVTWVAYRTDSAASWTEVPLLQAPATTVWQPRVAFFSGDGGGSLVNGRFVARLEAISIIAN